MKHRSFDSFVKERLGNVKPEVPARIWENIAAESGKKRPFIYGWFTGFNLVAALLILSAVSGTVYLVSNHNAKDKAGTVAVHDQQSTVVPGNNDVNNNGSDQVVNPVTDEANTASNNNNTSSTDQDHTTQGNVHQPANTFYIPGRSAVSIINPSGDNSFDESASSNQISGIAENNRSFSFPYNRGGIDMLKSSRMTDPRMKMPFMLRNLSIPCPEAEKNAAGNKKYIEVYGGPDYVFRSINDYDNGSYTQQRKQSTHMLISYSAGIRYTKVWGSGLSIRAGINYSRINEAFKQEKGHVIQNVYITNDSGDTTGTYSVSGTQYKQNTNKYTTIDVPVVAGYEIGNGRLHTNINAGIMVNLVSRQNAVVLDKGGNAVDISSGATPTVYQYKKNAGISLTGGVSVYYKLNEKLHLMAEPYFRYGLSPVTKNDLSLKQKYHTAGLRLGVRMDL